MVVKGGEWRGRILRGANCHGAHAHTKLHARTSAGGMSTRTQLLYTRYLAAVSIYRLYR